MLGGSFAKVGYLQNLKFIFEEYLQTWMGEVLFAEYKGKIL